MKLLLDESIPRQLAASFPGQFEIHTVPQMGWAGSQNGALLELAVEHGFDALITADQGIEHQQNLAAFEIVVVIMMASRTRIQELEPLVPRVVDVLSGGPKSGVFRVAA